MDDIGRRLQFYRATAAYLQVENSEEGLSNCDTDMPSFLGEVVQR